jgi:hypothetical protein
MTATTSYDAPVLVTTQHRGVFFGYLTGSRDSTTLDLTDARMCIYWSADVKGVLGLAASGPSKSCRVGPAVPRLTLQDVTSVADVTAEAVKAWLAQPWS